MPLCLAYLLETEPHQNVYSSLKKIYFTSETIGDRSYPDPEMHHFPAPEPVPHQLDSILQHCIV
jgi:hypothetical protein